MVATTFTVIVIIVFSFIDHEKSADHSWVVPETLPYAFVSFVFAFGGIEEDDILVMFRTQCVSYNSRHNAITKELQQVSTK